jgi:hypothetical protein
MKKPTWNKISLPHLEKCDLQDVFISKINSILTGKQCAKCFQLQHRWFCLVRYMFFFNLSEKAYLEQTAPFFTLENLCCRKYFFQKLTQFSQGNNVFDVPPVKTEGFLLRDTFVSSTQVNRPIRSKISLSPP